MKPISDFLTRETPPLDQVPPLEVPGGPKGGPPQTRLSNHESPRHTLGGALMAPNHGASAPEPMGRVGFTDPFVVPETRSPRKVPTTSATISALPTNPPSLKSVNYMGPIFT